MLRGQFNYEYIQNHFMVTSKVKRISKRYETNQWQLAKIVGEWAILYIFETRTSLVYFSSNKKYFLQAKRSATVIKTRQ